MLMVFFMIVTFQLRSGSGFRCGTWAVTGGNRRGRRLSLRQASAGPVVIEDFSIASPILGGLKLALYFVFGEMLIEDIVEKFIRDGMIGLAFQDAVNLLQNHDVLEGGAPEQNFALLNVGVGECDALRRDLHIALF